MRNRGSKANALLNGEWAQHVKRDTKRATSRARRRAGRKDIARQLGE